MQVGRNKETQKKAIKEAMKKLYQIITATTSKKCIKNSL
jgi:hypothetical protein